MTDSPSPDLQMLLINDIYNEYIKSNNIELENYESTLNIHEICNYTADKVSISTNDVFYRRGILENVINEKYNNINIKFNIDDLEISDSLNNEQQQKHLLKKVSMKADLYKISSYLESYEMLDYNWLLGYYIMKYMKESKNIKFIKEITNNDLKLLIIGNKKNTFISGLHNYIQHNKISISMDWLSYDDGTGFVSLADKNIKRILKKKNIKPVNDELFNYNNITNIKIQVENKFNNVNFIFNNVNPITNRKSLLLTILFCISILSKNGICLVKLISPHIWCDLYKSYIQLYSMFFYSVKIIKFPVCKNKKYFYNYFLIAHSKKKIVDINVLYKKITLYYLTPELKIIKYNTDNSDTYIKQDIYALINEIQNKMINADIDIKILYNIIESIL